MKPAITITCIPGEYYAWQGDEVLTHDWTLPGLLAKLDEVFSEEEAGVDSLSR